MAEPKLDQETFNLSVRKFLKKVGVNSQREIERAVADGLKTGALKGNERLRAEVTLSIAGVKLNYRIEDDIALS
jgi:Family of unknown function (DUF6494)